MSDKHKKIADALEVAAGAYQQLAQEEMTGYGSPHSVYFAMKESIALSTKARRIRQNFLSSACTCNN